MSVPTATKKKERARLRKALFDELESRGYQPGLTPSFEPFSKSQRKLKAEPGQTPITLTSNIAPIAKLM